MAEIILTSENFENEVLKSDKNVLVDFWASWCGPCKMLAPTIEAIAEEYDSFKVGKVNVDDEPNLAQAYGISSIPTLILFKDGKAADMMVGLRSKDEIVKWAEG
jgi:thioredoxin 1